MNHCQRLIARLSALPLLALLAWAGFGAAPALADTVTVTDTTRTVTWTCVNAAQCGTTSFAAPALVWPSTAGATNAKDGFTTSRNIFLPAAQANGAVLSVSNGFAFLFANGDTPGSDRFVATVPMGTSYTVSGLASNERLSAIGSDFNYTLTVNVPAPEPEPPVAAASTLVAWVCSGTPCPWGSTLVGHAVVWPTGSGAITNRLGYNTSAPIYLPSSRANGTIVWIDSGSATLYAGQPGGSSHRVVATLTAGGFHVVSGLAVGEVLSVQSDSQFVGQISLGVPSGPPDEDPLAALSSRISTWNCTGFPCPWGSSVSGHVLAWPAAGNPTNVRLGYTTTLPTYLPSASANGASIEIVSGAVALFAGAPGGSAHRQIAVLTSGGAPYVVSGLADVEVLSVQSEYPFTYRITLPDAPPPPPPPPDREIIPSQFAYWRCNTPNCSGPDWTGAVINWPSWAAYPNNNRAGNNSRTVYSTATGEVLYPYMGSWANGCEVRAEEGTVLIIEWQRGTESWRETYINAGQTYTIQLTSPEDGAMIEANDPTPGFKVSLRNCTPQPLP